MFRLKMALERWLGSVAELGNLDPLPPPLPEAKPLESWFEDEEEEDGPK
jgi:hypothetical protein